MTQSMVSTKTMVGGITAALLALVVVLIGLPASAQTVELDFDDVAVGGDEGTTVEIGKADVDSELVGRSCNLVAEVQNQSSVHPGNKLIVTSGDSTLEIEAIEDTADGLTSEAGTLTLGETIVVAVQFGPNQYTSLGSNLTVTCEPLPPSPPPSTVPADPPYSG